MKLFFAHTGKSSRTVCRQRQQATWLSVRGEQIKVWLSNRDSATVRKQCLHLHGAFVNDSRSGRRRYPAPGSAVRKRRAYMISTQRECRFSNDESEIFADFIYAEPGHESEEIPGQSELLVAENLLPRKVSCFAGCRRRKAGQPACTGNDDSRSMQMEPGLHTRTAAEQR